MPSVLSLVAADKRQTWARYENSIKVCRIRIWFRVIEDVPSGEVWDRKGRRFGPFGEQSDEHISISAILNLQLRHGHISLEDSNARAFGQCNHGQKSNEIPSFVLGKHENRLARIGRMVDGFELQIPLPKTKALSLCITERNNELQQYSTTLQFIASSQPSEHFRKDG